MKREFSYYEFAGLLVPGGVVIVGILALLPRVAGQLFAGGIGVGEFGLLILVAYALGHLLQGIGNTIESGWWWLVGRGMPTDWLRSGRRFLLADSQRIAVFAKVRETLGVSLPDDISTLPKREWHAVVRQAYAEVARNKAAKRIDAFTGNYGINRGLGAAFLVLGAVSLPAPGGHGWRLYVALAVCTALAVARMHRFGVHYARELFVQFLQTQRKEGEI